MKVWLIKVNHSILPCFLFENDGLAVKSVSTFLYTLVKEIQLNCLLCLVGTHFCLCRQWIVLTPSCTSQTFAMFGQFAEYFVQPYQRRNRSSAYQTCFMTCSLVLIPAFMCTGAKCHKTKAALIKIPCVKVTPLIKVRLLILCLHNNSATPTILSKYTDIDYSKNEQRMWYSHHSFESTPLTDFSCLCIYPMWFR